MIDVQTMQNFKNLFSRLKSGIKYRYWMLYFSFKIGIPAIGMRHVLFYSGAANRHRYGFWVGNTNYSILPFKNVIEIVCDRFATVLSDENVTPGEVFKREYDWWKGIVGSFNFCSKTRRLVTKILWNFKEYYTNYEKVRSMDAKYAEKNTLKTIRLFINGWKNEYENG